MGHSITGIIAEYNPFHNGHLYLIDYAKSKLNSDYIIVVMSGNFTQRGTPAICDKYVRAKAALSCGADLVLQLPNIVATSGARIFATGAVAALHRTGLITDLVFGAETANITMFNKVATSLFYEDEAFQNILKDELKNGASYSKAVSSAMTHLTGDSRYSEFLSTPNNLLGVEYCRALKETRAFMRPHCIVRSGAGHRDADASGSFASSSAIRNLFRKDQLESTSLLMPDISYRLLLEEARQNRLVWPEDLSLPIHMALFGKKSFARYLDCGEDLSNRILNNRNQYAGYSEFIERLSSKNMIKSRISRVLLHILLEDTTENLHELAPSHYAPYLHVIGMTEHGRSLLSQINEKKLNLPLFLSPQEILGKNGIGKIVRQSIRKDLHADEIYHAIQTKKCRQPLPSDLTRKIEVEQINDGTAGFR